MELDYSGIIEKIKTTRHPGFPESNGLQRTCVFMLLCNPEAPYVLFILKADTEGYPWRNQMALPGGHVDKNDPSPLHAAYRELEEELNITREHVDYIGTIGHFATIKNKDIQAFFGFWDEHGNIRFDPSEIARVVRVPLTALFQTHIEKKFTEYLPGYDRLLYPYDDIVIWGATARIIHYYLNLTLPFVNF